MTWPFRRPKALRMAEDELEDAKMALLQAHTGLEYAQSMVAYNTARVRRLAAHVEAERAVLERTMRQPYPDLSYNLHE
jgi:hypothetical protein